MCGLSPYCFVCKPSLTALLMISRHFCLGNPSKIQFPASNTLLYYNYPPPNLFKNLSTKVLVWPSWAIPFHIKSKGYKNAGGGATSPCPPRYASQLKMLPLQIEQLLFSLLLMLLFLQLQNWLELPTSRVLFKKFSKLNSRFGRVI